METSDPPIPCMTSAGCCQATCRNELHHKRGATEERFPRSQPGSMSTLRQAFRLADRRERNLRQISGQSLSEVRAKHFRHACACTTVQLCCMPGRAPFKWMMNHSTWTELMQAQSQILGLCLSTIRDATMLPVAACLCYMAASCLIDPGMGI